MPILKPAKKIVGALLLLLAVSDLRAQTVMTLEQCIRYAIDNNLQIRQAQDAMTQSGINLSRAKATLLPSFNSYSQGTNSFGRSIDPVTNQYVNAQSQNFVSQLSAELVLFGGLTKLNDVRQARWQQEAGKWNLQKVKDDIGLTVANQYLQWLLLKHRRVQVQEQLKNDSMQLELVIKQSNLGAANPAKLSEQKAIVYTTLSTLTDLDAQISRARLALQQTMNFDLRVPIEIADIDLPELDIDVQEKDLNDILDNRIDRLPAVEFANSNMQASSYRYRMVQGAQYPTLALSGNVRTAYSSITRSYSYRAAGLEQIGIVNLDTNQRVFGPKIQSNAAPIPFGEQLRNNFGQQLGLSLSFNIFNGLQTRFQIAEARNNLTIALNNKTLAQTQARNDVITAYEAVKNGRRKLAAASARYDAQAVQFNNVTKLFNAGAVSSYEYNTARANYNSAQIDKLNSGYELLFEIKVFEYYRGKAITSDK